MRVVVTGYSWLHMPGYRCMEADLPKTSNGSYLTRHVRGRVASCSLGRRQQGARFLARKSPFCDQGEQPGEGSVGAPARAGFYWPQSPI